MKRIASFLLALLMVISLCACAEIQQIIDGQFGYSDPFDLGTTSTAAPLGGSEGTQDNLPLDTTDPETTKPESTEPEITEPEVTEPKPTQPKPTQPKPTEPKPTEPKPTEPKPTEPKPTEPALDPNGSYDSKEDVALYIHLYGKLPPNYITKSQARNLGWKSGSLERYAPGKCIGGDTFQNREGLLPKKSGRTYKECDIDTLGASARGAKRIVFSNDGLVYYTSDHYKSFTLLYGEP